MLVLSRQRDESIIIGDNVIVTIVDIRGDKVRLGIEAPAEIPVHRQEVYDAIRREASRPAMGRAATPKGSRPVESGKSRVFSTVCRWQITPGFCRHSTRSGVTFLSGCADASVEAGRRREDFSKNIALFPSCLQCTSYHSDSIRWIVPSGHRRTTQRSRRNEDAGSHPHPLPNGTITIECLQ